MPRTSHPTKYIKRLATVGVHDILCRCNYNNTYVIICQEKHDFKCRKIKDNYGDEMIKQYRIEKGYTQEQLAEIINISTRQLQRIEENEENTKIKTLKRLIKVLQIPDKEIIDFMKK